MTRLARLVGRSDSKGSREEAGRHAPRNSECDRFGPSIRSEWVIDYEQPFAIWLLTKDFHALACHFNRVSVGSGPVPFSFHCPRVKATPGPWTVKMLFTCIVPFKAKN